MRLGDRVADRFVVEGDARSGGMSSVFRARDASTGETVALKVLAKPDAERLARFWREAEVLEQLRHPRIVRLVGHGQTPDGHPFLAMEWLEGEDLADRLDRGPLGGDEATRLVLHVADALAVAHAAGVVHRDIKPANLFLVGGRVDDVMVLDFGIARISDGSAITQYGTTIGTPSYMSPEQARGQLDVDARADVFSLGCVVYHCLTGAPPFVAHSPLAVMAKIVIEDPPSLAGVAGATTVLESLCAAMLAKDRAERLADGAAVREMALRLERRSRRPPIAGGGITESEQRLLSVIVARTPAWGADDPATPRIAALSPALLSEADNYGGRAERLADGSIIVIVEGADDATDQVMGAASCALALRALAPEIPISLATGKGHRRCGTLVGEALEAAFELVAPWSTWDAAHPSVLVDEMTAGLLGEPFAVRVDEVSGARFAERVSHEGAPVQRLPPIVGRSDELAQLLALHDRMWRLGTAQVAFVSGAAGLGKTRLARALVERVESRGRETRWWRVRADPLRSRVPFGLAAEIVQRAIEAAGSSADLRAGLDAALGPIPPGPVRDRARAFLAEILGLGAALPEGVELRAARHDPFLMNDQIRRAFIEWLQAVTGERPLLLIVDDLHWADRKSIELLNDALASLDGQPWMVVGLGRPEPSDWLAPTMWRDAVMPLGKLDPEAANLLVYLSLETATASVAEQMVERANGNPRVLEELIRAAERGEHDRLPPTVLALAHARIERLDPEVRRILRAGSVFGVGFTEPGLLSVLGEEDPEGARAGITRLVADGLLVGVRSPTGQRWELTSEIDREAAYGMLTDEDRAEAHRLAGAWLARQPGAEPFELASHLERGGERARAAAPYLMAAEHAMSSDDHESAREAAQRALDCADPGDAALRGRARLVLAQAYRWLADYHQTERWARLAMDDLEPGAGRWFVALGLVALASARMSSFASVEDLEQLALEQRPLGAIDEIMRVIALCRLTWGAFISGRGERADALIAEVEASSLREDPVVAAPYARTSGLRAAWAGDVGLASVHWRRAVELFEALGNRRDATGQRINVGFSLVTLGQYEAAEALLREAREDARALRLWSVAAGALQNLGIALSRRGRHEEACRCLRESIDAFAEQGDRRLEAGSRIYLSEALLGLHDLSAALREANAACRMATDIPPMACVALAAAARVLLADERCEEALESSAEAMRGLKAQNGVEEGESLVYLVRIQALAATGNQVAAHAIANEGRDRLLYRASRIEDETLRSGFLERVADNRELMRLAAADVGVIPLSE